MVSRTSCQSSQSTEGMRMTACIVENSIDKDNKMLVRQLELRAQGPICYSLVHLMSYVSANKSGNSLLIVR